MRAQPFWLVNLENGLELLRSKHTDAILVKRLTSQKFFTVTHRGDRGDYRGAMAVRWADAER